MMVIDTKRAWESCGEGTCYAFDRFLNRVKGGLPQMRQLVAATAVVGFLATGLACAQMKSAVPPGTASSSPQVKTATPIPVAQTPPEEARRITREEAIKMIKAKKAVFVDVRGKDSYDQSHIKGAINIPLGDILTRIKEIPPKTFIITYCA
jgi:hypothetical protein